RLILNPDDFHILVSKQKLSIPPQYAGELVNYDPSMGEFRVHYAGFFDPGFGHGGGPLQATRAVLEVRSHEVPFLLEDGQSVTRMLFTRVEDCPDKLYGPPIGSSYQKQEIQLARQFRSH